MAKHFASSSLTLLKISPIKCFLCLSLHRGVLASSPTSFNGCMCQSIHCENMDRPFASIRNRLDERLPRILVSRTHSKKEVAQILPCTERGHLEWPSHGGVWGVTPPVMVGTDSRRRRCARCPIRRGRESLVTRRSIFWRSNDTIY